MIHILVRFKPYPHIPGKRNNHYSKVNKKAESLECWFEQDPCLPVEQVAANQFFKQKLVFFTHLQDLLMRKELSLSEEPFDI